MYESKSNGVALLRVQNVLQAFGVSRSTLWRWRMSGTFPKPIQLGPRIIAWRQTDLDNWLRQSEEDTEQ